MKFSQIIAAVGDEHVRLQGLAPSMKDGRARKDHDEITFVTERGRMDDTLRACSGVPHQWSAFVVWIPADRLEVARKQLEEGGAK